MSIISLKASRDENGGQTQTLLTPGTNRIGERVSARELTGKDGVRLLMIDALIAGVGMAPVANHWPGVGIKLGRQAAVSTLQDAGLAVGAIDSMVVGTAHLPSPRGIYLSKELGLTGIPVQTVSNASATRLAAMHSAVESILGEEAKRVLVQVLVLVLVLVLVRD